MDSIPYFRRAAACRSVVWRGVVWCDRIWALQGLDKKQTVEKHGMDQVMVWRRSYTTPPPFLDDDRYIRVFVFCFFSPPED